MKLSESWLRSQTNLSIDTNLLVKQLTMAGLEVDSVSSVKAISGVKIAQIADVQPHPDADKLKVCDVNDGDNIHKVVCGAPNAKIGRKIPFATIGAILPGDFEIKKTKIRGVESNGMLCAQDELGLGDDSAGLWELPLDAPIGEDLSNYLELNDNIIDIDLTPNRGDCLSLRGISREIGVINNCDVVMHLDDKVHANINDSINCTISAPEGCARYISRVIKNINLNAKTPIWMQEKLRRSGIRSRSPIVDVTNYVLLEIGQPMHAFDLSKIDGEIIVRYANKENLKLLDDTFVSLDKDTLVISDQSKVLAMAGIMGGEDSSVGPLTDQILLESAWFNPKIISGKARKYGKHTDSSHRFERGVDPEIQYLAIERATSLILDICEGIPGPITETVLQDYLPDEKSISFDNDEIQKQLGIEVEGEEIERIFGRLGLTKKNYELGFTTWNIPSWRFDLEIQQDLIEEVARIKGYDNLPVTLPRFEAKTKNVKNHKTDIFKDILVNKGYQEAVTYSFIDPEVRKLLFKNIQGSTLLNPISNEMSEMRVSVWPGLINAALHNLNRQQTRIRLFELGQCFMPVGNTVMGYQTQFAGLICGSRYEKSWSTTAANVDFYDLKGDVETLLYTIVKGEECEFRAKAYDFFHPGQSAEILIDKEVAGCLGRLHPSIESKLNFKQPVYLFEINIDKVVTAIDQGFESISKFPEVRRDLAFLVDESVQASALISAVKNAAGKYLVDLKLFDVYEGKDIENKGKSIALGLTFQHPCRTLTETEINSWINDAVTASLDSFGATLRS